MTCAESKAHINAVPIDIRALNEATGNKGVYNFCPGCDTLIERSSGCTHMTCLQVGCGTEFCMVCGRRDWQNCGHKGPERYHM